MKRAQLNLVLLGVACALGVGVFFAQKKEPPGPPLTAYKPDAVTRIALTHPGAPDIRLEKKDGHWKLTAPVSGDADEFEVAAITGLADRETKMKVEGGAPKELGLEPPSLTLTLNDTTIAFGGVETLEYRRYVSTGGVTYLIDDPPGSALDRDYHDLVAKDVVPKDSEIQGLALPKLTLARGADGKWAVTPADPKATADAMQKLADSWKGARSMWNEMTPVAPTGDKVTVTLKDGSTREFVVATLDPQLKLYRPDLKVTLVLSKALGDELFKLPEPPPPPAPKEEAKPAADAKPAEPAK